MKRKTIQAVCLGKRTLNYKGKNIKISVYIDEKSLFVMIKGERVELFEINKKLIVKQEVA